MERGVKDAEQRCQGRCGRIFFSCIAGQVGDMVSQLLEIRVELKIKLQHSRPGKFAKLSKTR